MTLNKLTQLSVDELQKKEKDLRIVLMMFIIVLVMLTIVLAYLVYNKGITPIIAVPIALLPVLLYGKRSLKEIKTEMQSRG